MTEEKRNRIMAAVAVTVVLLITILVAIVIYQLVVISSINGEKRKIEDEIKYYEEQTVQQQDELEYLQSKENLQNKLLEYGYHF